VQQVSTSDAGVRVKWKTADRSDGKHESLTDAIVIFAGTASRRFAARLGDRVNIYSVKRYSITVNLDDPLSQHQMFAGVAQKAPIQAASVLKRRSAWPTAHRRGPHHEMAPA
jgi:hypothetical protein